MISTLTRVVRSHSLYRAAALAAILGVTVSAQAGLIPSDRVVDWTPGVSVGVPGGIPTNRTNLIDVTKSPYNADSTGATDASAAIQSAINAAAPGDVVYLPAGTYLCQNALNTNYRSGFTIRGAGESTILKNTAGGSTFLSVGGGSDYTWSWPGTGNTITAGLTKGSTQLTIADTSAFSVGQLVQLKMNNDANFPVISVFGYEGMRRQMTRVTGKTATTLTISPALYGDYSATPAVVHVAQFQANGVGLEDFVIDSSSSTAVFSICFEQCYGCWAKNIHVKYSTNYHIYIVDSLNCEVRHCYLDQLNHSGSNGSGLLVNTVSGSLFEDNIIYKSYPHIEVNHGSCGNVIAYNYCVDSGPGVAIDSNHGPHNDYNLYEGNVAPNLQCDGYFGGASDDTLFRNWLTGLLNGQPSWCVSLNRFTRYYSLVGNIFQSPGYTWTGDGVGLGNPNMGNGSSTGTAPPWTDGLQNGAGTLTQSGTTVSTSSPMFSSSMVGWFIMTPATSVLCTITAYTDSQHVTVNNTQSLTNVAYVVSPGPSGYQELDTGVAGTLVRTGNYYYVNGGIPSAEALGTNTLPASLFRTTKPDYFGTLAWPAFDPTNPNPSVASIPAGYRYLYGTDPTGTSGGTSSGGSSGTTTGTTTTTTTPQVPLNVRVSHS